MAIIIPSKNIYEKKNEKIRDNVIGQIEVNATEVEVVNDYGEIVANEKITQFIVDDGTNASDESLKYDREVNYLSSSDTYVYNLISAAYCEYNTFKKTNITLKIPVLLKNKYIEKILYGLSANGEYNIKYSLYGKTETGVASSTFKYSHSSAWETDGYKVKVKKGDISYSNATAETESTIVLPRELNYTHTYAWEVDHSVTLDVTASSTINDVNTTIGSAIPSIKKENGVEYFKLNFDILCGVTTVTLGGGVDATDSGELVLSGDITMRGTYTKYTPTQIEVTVYGITIGIDLNEKTVYIPENASAKNVFSMDNNELLQTTNARYEKKYYTVAIGGGLSSGAYRYVECYPNENYGFTDGQKLLLNNEPAYISGVEEYESEKNKYYTLRISIGGEWDKYMNNKSTYFSCYSFLPSITLTDIFADVKDKYANGKETATLRCSIADYYDGNGVKRISKDEAQIFSIYDKVQPMICGANGQDTPMSKNKDGLPKEFQVLSTKIFFDGAVWQELTLQEVD